jgi:hypothetical protein
MGVKVMGELYQGDQMAVVMWFPKGTYKAEIEADFIDDNMESKTVVWKMTPDDIREARNDYLTLDPYDDAFATYVISDKAKKELEELDDDLE